MGTRRLSTEDQRLRNRLAERARRGDTASAFLIYDRWPRHPGSAHWLRIAAEAGHVEAEQQLYFHCNERNDHTGALRWLRRAAERGDPEWMNFLGEALRDGDCGRKRYRQAAEWFRRSAEAGDSGGALNYGYSLFYGIGVTRNRQLAARWYQTSTKSGFERQKGMLNLGHMHRCGDGVPADAERAMYWYRRAAKRGNRRALYWVAMLHDGSHGHPESGRLAVKWLRRAVARFHPECCAVLGLRYAEGRGVGRSAVEAARLYRQGAEEYNPECYYLLGRAYEEGLGVRKNSRLAVHWLRKAALHARDEDRRTAFSAEEALAALHWWRGEHPEARRRGERALSLAENNRQRARVQHTLGFTYEALGLLVEAHAAFSASSRLNRSDSEVRREVDRLAGLLAAQGTR